MNYINKFETTEAFNQAIGGGQLSELEHFVAYDAEANMVHVAPKPNFIIVTTSASDVKMNKYNETGIVESVVLEQGENKIKNIDYGWICDSSSSSIISFDLSNYNTSQVKKMSNMFRYCSSLKSLDISRFDTSNVTTMDEMFYNCSSLTSLDLSSFDTSKVTNMYQMFGYCSGLTSLDVSSFDTSQVTDMTYMFYRCSGLRSLDVSNFDISKVTKMNNMFFYCNSLTSLDLSTFDTSQVTTMYSMFKLCDNLKSLDLSSFDTSKITNMDAMFSSCNSLTHIKCKQAFKDWCITNKTTINLPSAMENGTVGGIGSGSNWEIIDYSE